MLLLGTSRLKDLAATIADTRAVDIALRARALARAGRRRLFIFDPGCVARSGHHAEFNDTVRAEAERRGFAVLSIVNAEAPRAGNEMGSVKRLFRASPYRAVDWRLPPSRFLLQESARAYRDLKRLSLIDFKPDDTVLWHTITPAHLAALARWYGELEEGHRPRLLAQFQFPVGFHVAEGIGLETPQSPGRLAAAAMRTYRWSTSRIDSTGSARLATNSRLLQEHYSGIAAPKPSLIPFPIRWGKASSASVRRAGAVRIAYLGGARIEKGFALLPKAITLLSEKYQNTEFVVQCPSEALVHGVVERLVAMSPPVRLVPEVLSRERFMALLHEVDCVVLPYDPDRYRLRTSGLFVEALGAGRPVVTTAGSWMASVIEEHRLPALFMEKFDAPSLAAAVDRFLMGIDRYRSAYAKVAPAIRDAHNPERFLDRIEALF